MRRRRDVRYKNVVAGARPQCRSLSLATTLAMGRKVLLTVICWLTLSGALGKSHKNVKSSVVKDNESAESAQRLYRNVPVGVYASAAPYASYSINVPTIVKPQSGGPQYNPAKAATFAIPQLINLKDSYGKLVASPQMAGFKTTLPQQYVQLQALPAHLAQPLVSASPTLQYKSAPNYFFGPHSYNAPALLGPGPVPVNHFAGAPQHLVYAGNVKSFAPLSSVHISGSNQPPANEYFSNELSYQEVKESPKFKSAGQGYKDTKQQASHQGKGHIQAAPAQTQTNIETVVNGKKTVVTLNTKPPLPLLDLNLLEPLKFDNPLVPQIQNFLPKISSATYHKLPSFNIKDLNKQKDVVLTKTQSYDTGYVKAQNPKKKQNKVVTYNKAKPGITVKGYPNSGDYAYEINTPNHKETYNEQVIKYNKQTNKKPVEYSYNEQSQEEPEVYSYMRTSKEPLKVTHVEYSSDADSPQQLIYESGEQEEEEQDDRQPSSQESDDSEESSFDSEEEGPTSTQHYESPPKQQNQQYYEIDSQSPKHNQKEYSNSQGPISTQHYESGPKQQNQQYYEIDSQSPKHNQKEYSNSQGPTSTQHYESGPKQQNQQYYEIDSQSPKHNQKEYSNSPPPSTVSYVVPLNQFGMLSQVPKPTPSFQFHPGLKVLDATPKSPQQHQQFVFLEQPKQHTPNINYQIQHEGLQPQYQGAQQGQSVSSTPSHQLKVEHRAQPQKQAPKQEVRYQIVQTTSKYFNQPVTVNGQNAFQPVKSEYNQNIRFFPTHSTNGQVQINPNQIMKVVPIMPQFFNFVQSSPAPQKISARTEKEVVIMNSTPRSFPEPHVHEKSKRIIIKEEEETPDERHIHSEQSAGEMIKQEENNEEDFEKAYKESAFGFPAYDEKSTEDIEKDIYKPESYGVSPLSEFKIEDSPYQEYVQEGNQFPKSARLAYKDARDNNKEDYFLEFAVNKPTSYADRVKNQVEYYKMFKKHRPGKSFYEHGFDVDDDNKEKKSEKFTVAPSFDFFENSPKSTSRQSKHFGEYKAAPIKYEYDYSKETPRDSISYASKPFRRTHFVEPQFQYGFEPMSTPIVVDSELAAMASNDNPESEKPGTRKKIYKENWYIKKTSTTGSKPS